MHLPDKSKLKPDSETWPAHLARVDRKLGQLRDFAKAPKGHSASIVPATTVPTATAVAILVKGVYSSASDPVLDPVAALFPAPIRPLSFNFNGHARRPYGPDDTVSDSLATYADRLAEYFEVYPEATVHLACHSLGGLIVMKLLYAKRREEAFWQRVAAVYLLASPVLLGGQSLYEQVRHLGLHDPAWKIAGE